MLIFGVQKAKTALGPRIEDEPHLWEASAFTAAPTLLCKTLFFHQTSSYTKYPFLPAPIRNAVPYFY